MEITRRNFLKSGSLAMAGALLLSEYACSGRPGKTVTALQLYSVRGAMNSDPLGTLTRLAEMGYTHVEHAHYVDQKFYGWTAREFRKVLDDLGLHMPSGHTVLRSNHWDASQKDFTGEWKKLVEDAAYMGQEYVVSPSMEAATRKSYDQFMAFMEVFNACGELCKKSGMRFGYHNHDFEFSETLNGEKLFDIIMKNTDADKVVMQLDMGNMFIAGALAEEVLKQYPGRYDNIHVKDMVRKADGKGFESTILGEGLVNTKNVCDLGLKMGTRLFVIEQESYQGKSPLDCMNENLAVMKAWGY
jgi:sugar phosphate isomerase/epimerase